MSQKLVTHFTKQVHFDKDLLDELTDGETTEYYLFCLSPASRWLLSTLVSFYSEYYNRWDNFSGQREIDQLVAETLEGLGCEVACREDIQAINVTLGEINATMVEIRDALGGETADLDERLVEIKTELADLDLSLVDLGLPDLIDKLEPILNGVGVILGAPTIPLNGA